MKAVSVDALGATVDTSAEVTFTTANTIYYINEVFGENGTTHNVSLSCTPATGVGSNWSGSVGVTCTQGGTWHTGPTPDSNPNTLAICMYIDGALNASSCHQTLGTTTAISESWDTTKFPNGTHHVAIITFAADNGGMNNNNPYAQWEREVTFANGAANSRLQLSAREVFLCASPVTNCQSSATLTGVLVKTDGTTSAATLSCTVNDTSIASKTSTCTVNFVALGVTFVTATASGFSRKAWIWNQGQNSIANIGRDRLVHQNYDATNSVFLSSMFFGSNIIGDYQSSVLDYKAISFNALEQGVIPDAMSSYHATSQSSFQSTMSSYVTSGCASATSNGLLMALSGDNAGRNDQDVWETVAGTPSGLAPANWTTPGLTYAMNQWAACGVAMVVDWNDEVNGAYGLTPAPGPLTLTSGVTSVVCTSDPCVANIPTFCAVSGYCMGTTGNRFTISGSVTSGMNSAVNTTYTKTNINNTSFSFPRPAGVGSVTLNSGNDPGLTINIFATRWNFSTGFLANNAFCQLMALARGGTAGRPLSTWPSDATGTAPNGTFQNWEFEPTSGVCVPSDYATLYRSDEPASVYLADRASLFSEVDSSMDFWRRIIGHTANPFPLLMLTGSIETQQGLVGRPVTVTSCSGNTITLSAPHNIGSIHPGTTRIAVTGSSDSACNNSFIITATPTATTLSVVRGLNTSSTGGFNNGTITFQDTTAFTLSNGSASNDPERYNFANPASDPTCQIVRKRGQTAVITGTTLSGWTGPDINGQTLYAAPWGNAACVGGITGVNWYFVPSFSGAGGTGRLYPNNYYVPGRDSTFYAHGYRWLFGTPLEAAIVGGAGQRAYAYGVNGSDAESHNTASGLFSSVAATVNRKFVDNYDAQDYQNGILSAPTAAPELVSGWWAKATANKLISALVPCLYATRLPSPDYGPYMEATARTSATCNVILAKSFLDNPQTITFDLTPVTISGQQSIQHLIKPSGIQTTILAANTTSVAVTLEAGDAIAFVHPTTFAGSIQQRVQSFRLADVTNATKIVVEYAYTSYALDSTQTDYLPLTVDCGTGSNCPIPVDLGIGLPYWRVKYLDTNGVVLARGAIQQ